MTAHVRPGVYYQAAVRRPHRIDCPAGDQTNWHAAINRNLEQSRTRSVITPRYYPLSVG